MQLSGRLGTLLPSQTNISAAARDAKMSAEFTWLYTLAHTASQLVLLGVYGTGLVICLRRWHVAPGMKWFAAGFLIFAVLNVLALGSSLLFWLIQESQPAGSSASTVMVANLYFTLLTLLAIGGAICLVIGAISLARTLAHRENHVLRPAEDL